MASRSEMSLVHSRINELYYLTNAADRISCRIIIDGMVDCLLKSMKSDRSYKQVNSFADVKTSH